jgi:hypothetical protein
MAAVGVVIGVAVAASVVVVIEPRDETAAMTEMRFMGEVAASRGEVLTHTAASESSASTAEMARTEASDVSAAGEAADVSGAAEAAYASPAEPAADMSASAKPASMSPTEAATMSTTAAARRRISGQCGGESGSRREDDHRLT